MINWIKNLILKHKASKLTRKVRVYNLSTAKSALILYNYRGEKREREVRDFAKFLKEEGVKTSSLAYLPKKFKDPTERPMEELQYFYFDKGETNWFKIPVSRRLNEIIQEPYHILIDFNLEESFPLKWISYLSGASFKVGGSKAYQRESCDLLLELKAESISSLQEQCKIYLRMINQKNQS